jgi:hypothetical protein
MTYEDKDLKEAKDKARKEARKHKARLRENY